MMRAELSCYEGRVILFSAVTGDVVFILRACVCLHVCERVRDCVRAYVRACACVCVYEPMQKIS